MSVLALAAGLGAGIALAALPIADLGTDSWRIIYAISLIWIILAIILQRKMPETTRFIENHKNKYGQKLISTKHD